MMVLFYMEEYL